MTLDEYASLDALALADRVRRGDVSAAELAELATRSAHLLNPYLNAIIELYPERISSPEPPEPGQPFGGVPFLVKDLSITESGRLHECGSELLKGNVAKADSELVRKFRAAGLNILGRTTTPEFGWSASTESRLTGITRNPWNPGRSAGGSSGGSAAAVAAGIVPAAHGSDGSGSIRNPAGWCGLVGLKTSRGRISSAPAVGMPPGGRPVSFVLTRSVRDSAAMLDAVHGNIDGDPFRIAPPGRPYVEEMQRSPGKLRVAYTCEPWNGAFVTDCVLRSFRETLDLLRELGHELIEARPPLDWDTVVESVLATGAAGIAHRVEWAARTLNRKPSPENLQSTTWVTYEHGRSLSASRLLDAIDYLDRVSRFMGVFLSEYDVLLTPTSTTEAPPHGTHDADQKNITTRQWSDIIHREDCFLLLANITGQPAISLPLHISANGLPIGMQFVGRMGDETTLFQLSAQLEAHSPWQSRKPGLHVANAATLGAS
jgi:amidase